MSKDRNTFQKRQRALEKQRKAEDKRRKRTLKRQTPVDPLQPLSKAENSVLGVFRTYLMPPNRLLCFSAPDQATYRQALLHLVERKMLVAEKFQGSYSLTESGYHAMKAETSDLA